MGDASSRLIQDRFVCVTIVNILQAILKESPGIEFHIPVRACSLFQMAHVCFVCCHGSVTQLTPHDYHWQEEIAF